MEKRMCPHCMKYSGYEKITQSEEIKIRGISVQVEAQFLKCMSCSEEYDDPKSDFDLMDLAYREYRRKKKYLQPEEIKDFRLELKATQKEMCHLLGWGDATLSRYENGSLQEESHDRAFQMAMTFHGIKKLLDLADDQVISLERKEEIIRCFKGRFNSPYVVSISEHQRAKHPEMLNYKASEDNELIELTAESICYG
jgi:putative zinc finger/helix-turn-helix YgiT family protein